MLTFIFKTPDKYDPGEYVSLIYADRMRTADDKARMVQLYEDVFQCPPYKPTGQVVITTDILQVGHSFLKRKDMITGRGRVQHHSLLHHILMPLESLMKCIEMDWMTILVNML